jgi:23S rRNA (uracil1939-C5)-methyltransferase
MQNTPAVIRFSAARKNKKPETIIEKTAPFINIDNHKVFISAGTFLQPSVAGERALIDLVLKYIGNTTGNIADLFCGIGTFSYPLSKNIKNKILAVDSSAESLNNFQKTVNALKIPNIKIEQKNLFKYALDAHDLKNFSAVVFDPPRAGAQSQTKQLAALPQTEKPQKIVAISCNPQTFVNDANTLIAGGYQIKEITMVDQFVYTRHCELVALFEI